jgi:hypothetical protein
MKNSQKGFIIPLLLIIIVIVVVGGIYMYRQDKPINVATTSTNNHQLVCTYPLSSTDDSQFQSGLGFWVDGKNCAFLIQDNSGIRVNINGALTKAYPSVYLMEERVNFSPDGKHFAFTASNLTDAQFMALPKGGSFLKGSQRFIVSDNTEGRVFDEIVYPQYSKDSQHLGYCGQRNGQWSKVIDGKEQSVTKEFVFDESSNGCKSLFGYNSTRFSLENSQEATSADSSLVLKFPVPAPTNTRADFQASATITNTKTGQVVKYGPYWDRISYAQFSPDSKHFAYTTTVIDNLGSLNQQQYDAVILDGKIVDKYNEALNLYFSSDSKALIYNSRIKNSVYYITEPVN